MRLLNPKKNSTLYKLEKYVQRPHFLIFLLLTITLPITLVMLYQQQNFRPEASLVESNNLSNEDLTQAIPTIDPADTSVSGDITSPSVIIRHPANGKQVFEKTFLSILSLARDDVGVARLEVRINGDTVCSHHSDKSICKWQIPEGKGLRYIITARAFDYAGNSNSKNVEIITK